MKSFPNVVSGFFGGFGQAPAPAAGPAPLTAFAGTSTVGGGAVPGPAARWPGQAPPPHQGFGALVQPPARWPGQAPESQPFGAPQLSPPLGQQPPLSGAAAPRHALLSGAPRPGSRPRAPAPAFGGGLPAPGLQAPPFLQQQQQQQQMPPHTRLPPVSAPPALWDAAPPSDTIFVRELPPHASLETLQAHFGTFGTVRISRFDPAKGQAAVTFDGGIDAAKAAKKNGRSLQGVPIKIGWDKLTPLASVAALPQQPQQQPPRPYQQQPPPQPHQPSGPLLNAFAAAVAGGSGLPQPVPASTGWPAPASTAPPLRPPQPPPPPMARAPQGLALLRGAAPIAAAPLHPAHAHPPPRAAVGVREGADAYGYGHGMDEEEEEGAGEDGGGGDAPLQAEQVILPQRSSLPGPPTRAPVVVTGGGARQQQPQGQAQRRAPLVVQARGKPGAGAQATAPAAAGTGSRGGSSSGGLLGVPPEMAAELEAAAGGGAPAFIGGGGGGGAGRGRPSVAAAAAAAAADDAAAAGSEGAEMASDEEAALRARLLARRTTRPNSKPAPAAAAAAAAASADPQEPQQAPPRRAPLQIVRRKPPPEPAHAAAAAPFTGDEGEGSGEVSPLPVAAAAVVRQRAPAARHSSPDAPPAPASDGDGTAGQCATLCPAAEVEERARFNETWAFERPFPAWARGLPEFAGLYAAGKTLEELAVKVFKRSSAGSTEQTDPKNVRPPATLARAVTYLVERILDADAGGPDPRFPASSAPIVEQDDDDDDGEGGEGEGGAPSARKASAAATAAASGGGGGSGGGLDARPPLLLEVQDFVSNRLRAVARDFTSQNYRENGRNDALALEAHERMVRALALLSYELAETPSFQWALSEERFNAFLKSLMELYDDARARSVPGAAVLQSPNEPEFRAYYLLVHMADATGRAMCLAMLAAMPPAVLHAPPVQRALAVWAALETSNWARFFRLARSAAYVEACFLHRHLRAVRGRALRTLAGSMKEASLPGEDVQAALCTVDTDSARDYCEHHGLAVLPSPAAPCGWAIRLVGDAGRSGWTPGEGAIRRQLEPHLVHLQPDDEAAVAAAAQGPRPRGRRAALVDVRLWADDGGAGLQQQQQQQQQQGAAALGLLPRGAAAFPPQRSACGAWPGLGGGPAVAATDLWPGMPGTVMLGGRSGRNPGARPPPQQLAAAGQPGPAALPAPPSTARGPSSATPRAPPPPSGAPAAAAAIATPGSSSGRPVSSSSSLSTQAQQHVPPAASASAGRATAVSAASTPAPAASGPVAWLPLSGPVAAAAPPAPAVPPSLLPDVSMGVPPPAPAAPPSLAPDSSMGQPPATAAPASRFLWPAPLLQQQQQQQQQQPQQVAAAGTHAPPLGALLLPSSLAQPVAPAAAWPTLAAAGVAVAATAAAAAAAAAATPARPGATPGLLGAGFAFPPAVAVNLLQHPFPAPGSAASGAAPAETADWSGSAAADRATTAPSMPGPATPPPESPHLSSSASAVQASQQPLARRPCVVTPAPPTPRPTHIVTTAQATLARSARRAWALERARAALFVARWRAAAAVKRTAFARERASLGTFAAAVMGRLGGGSGGGAASGGRRAALVSLLPWAAGKRRRSGGAGQTASSPSSSPLLPAIRPAEVRRRAAAAWAPLPVSAIVAAALEGRGAATGGDWGLADPLPLEARGIELEGRGGSGRRPFKLVVVTERVDVGRSRTGGAPASALLWSRRNQAHDAYDRGGEEAGEEEDAVAERCLLTRLSDLRARGRGGAVSGGGGSVAKRARLGDADYSERGESSLGKSAAAAEGMGAPEMDSLSALLYVDASGGDGGVAVRALSGDALLALHRSCCDAPTAAREEEEGGSGSEAVRLSLSGASALLIVLHVRVEGAPQQQRGGGSIDDVAVGSPEGGLRVVADWEAARVRLVRALTPLTPDGSIALCIGAIVEGSSGGGGGGDDDIAAAVTAQLRLDALPRCVVRTHSIALLRQQGQMQPEDVDGDAVLPRAPLTRALAWAASHCRPAPLGVTLPLPELLRAAVVPVALGVTADALALSLAATNSGAYSGSGSSSCGGVLLLDGRAALLAGIAAWSNAVAGLRRSIAGSEEQEAADAPAAEPGLLRSSVATTMPPELQQQQGRGGDWEAVAAAKHRMADRITRDLGASVAAVPAAFLHRWRQQQRQPRSPTDLVGALGWGAATLALIAAATPAQQRVMCGEEERGGDDALDGFAGFAACVAMAPAALRPLAVSLHAIVAAWHGAVARDVAAAAVREQQQKQQQLIVQAPVLPLLRTLLQWLVDPWWRRQRLQQRGTEDDTIDDDDEAVAVAVTASPGVLRSCLHISAACGRSTAANPPIGEWLPLHSLPWPEAGDWADAALSGPAHLRNPLEAPPPPAAGDSDSAAEEAAAEDGGWWDSLAVPPEALFLMSLGREEGGGGLSLERGDAAHREPSPPPAAALAALDSSLASEVARYAAFTARLEALCAEAEGEEGGGDEEEGDWEEARSMTSEWLGPAAPLPPHASSDSSSWQQQQQWPGHRDADPDLSRTWKGRPHATASFGAGTGAADMAAEEVAEEGGAGAGGGLAGEVAAGLAAARAASERFYATLAAAVMLQD